MAEGSGKTVQPGTDGVTAAIGFQAAGGSAGIKKGNSRDMALIYSIVPCVAAGTFTTNLVKAAPVLWDQHIVKECESAQAVVINSGIANACTGREGYEACRRTAEAAARILDIPADSVLCASTGVIGQQIPVDKIEKGISLLAPMLSNSREAASVAAKAIMTTDTHPKEVSVSVMIGGKKVTIGGMCKGAGMIHPNMCTMLCFITTDCVIAKDMLQKALSEIIPDTFNMISVDGDTSTNDTVLVLANGLAGNPDIIAEDDSYVLFRDALYSVAEYLSKQIAGDGEGATALFEVKVVHAATKEQAKVLAKSVVTSNLTKAAIFGHDANWGRILCAMGYSGAKFDPEKTDLYFESAAGKIKIVENGVALNYSEREATRILSEPSVTAIADLREGEAEATAWGCDLTYDYVKINADYRS